MEREKEEPVKAAAVEAVSPAEKAAKIEVGKSFFSFSLEGGSPDSYAAIAPGDSVKCQYTVSGPLFPLSLFFCVSQS